MPLTNLDVIIKEAHDSKEEHATPNDHCLIGECKVSDMGDNPADKCGHNDCNSAHRGRALLHHVMFRPVILFSKDRLALSASLKKDDEVPGAEERDKCRHRSGDHDGDHKRSMLSGVVMSKNERATARSSNATTLPPRSCVSSCPLPAMTTMSPE